MATYLITGVAGFIGSALARAVLSQGHSVRGVDNFTTGHRENLAGIHKWIEFHETDILNLNAMQALCRGVDYVLHEAAIPSVPNSVLDPLGNNRTNVEGTLNVLVAARDNGVRRVVYAASSAAYGDSPAQPKHEDMVPNPISPYAVAKVAGEYYMTAFHRCYGLETVCLRYFNIFGPRQDPTSPYSGVLAKFITQMLQREQPTIFGDGETSRDFTHVNDAVRANLLACQATADRVAGQTLNIATGRSVSLNDIFHTLKRITGFRGDPKYGPKRAGDVQHSLADISKAKTLLAYTPTVDFEQGLENTVQWYDQELWSLHWGYLRAPNAHNSLSRAIFPTRAKSGPPST